MVDVQFVEIVYKNEGVKPLFFYAFFATRTPIFATNLQPTSQKTQICNNLQPKCCAFTPQFTTLCIYQKSLYLWAKMNKTPIFEGFNQSFSGPPGDCPGPYFSAFFGILQPKCNQQRAPVPLWSPILHEYLLYEYPNLIT